MTLEKKTSPDNKQCIHWKHEIEHVKKYKVQPNCLTCDGFGEDSLKNSWSCYNPYSKWRGKIE